ncbi:LysR family transcriptional regulator [Acinetobacter portensis]|uniref:LysR family transcriptional regulator n=1 Tax=Acinetobacter portensis TaxID=1839785 RepID=UPI0013D87DA6|nr:LysR family transcriptional regulator [Acinetobacter portensis]
MDTLKAIQVFVCIEKNGSLTKAADQLGYSRAMVSRYLEHLENHFSTRLLHRNTRNISLTSAGEKAILYCQNILQQQQLLKELSVEEQYTGTIRLTCGLFILQNGLAKAIQEFQQKYTHIRFDILITEETLDLVESQIDLAFRITTKVADGLISRPLDRVDSVLCAHADYLATSSEIVHPDQLLQHACITHHSMQNTWSLSTHQQQPQNYPIRIVAQSNDAHALHEMCLNKMGIAMLPKVMVERDLKDETLIPVLNHYEPPQLALSVVYSSRRHLPKKTQEFIAFVMDYLKK